MKIINPPAAVQQFIKENNLTDIFNQELINNLQVHLFKTNDYIIEEDSEVKYLYLVLSGKAGVFPSSLEGKSGLLDYIIPMDIVGDLEYFASANYFHSVVALSPCEYLAIPVSIIPTHFNKNINFYKFICVNMANKMQRTSKRYSRSIFYPLKNLLAKYLYDLAVYQSTPKLNISSSQAAERFGVSSRHIRRTLAEFATEGILIREKTQVHIIDMENLSKYLPSSKF